MNCEECGLILEEYVEGELEQSASDQVGSHLAVCAPCTAVYEELRREQEIYARYERNLEASPTLWTAIQKAIEEQKIDRKTPSFTRFRRWLIGAIKTPRFTPALTVVLVLLAIGMTAAMMKFFNWREVDPGRGAAPRAGRGLEHHSAPEPGSAVTARDGEKSGKEKESSHDTLGQFASGTSNPDGNRKEAPRLARPGGIKRMKQESGSSPRNPTPAELVREAEQKYLSAIALLSRDFKHQRSQVDPQVLAQFEQTLGAIDRTIAATRRVVQEHPSDPVAVQYMLTAYAKKVEVLEEMTRNAEGQKFL
jgi:hypothetical protein